MTTYRVIRMYRDHTQTRVIRRGLTLAEARAHCQDPETSSSTAVGAAARRRTKVMGPWFDGYDREDDRQDVHYHDAEWGNTAFPGPATEGCHR